MTSPLFAITTHQFLLHAGTVDKEFYIENLQLEPSEYELTRYSQQGVCLYKCGNERCCLCVMLPTTRNSSLAAQENHSNSITAAAIENISYFSNSSPYESARNRLIADSYINREVDYCVKSDGFIKLFDYKFSTLLCMLIIILTLSPIFSGEYSIGADRLIITSGKRIQAIKSKLITALVFTAAVSVLFYAEDILFVIIALAIAKMFLSLDLFEPDYGHLSKGQQEVFLRYMDELGGELTDEKEEKILSLYSELLDGIAIRRRI